MQSFITTYSKLHHQVSAPILLLIVGLAVHLTAALQTPQCLLEPKSHNMGPGGIHVPAKLAVRRMLISAAL